MMDFKARVTLSVTVLLTARMLSNDVMGEREHDLESSAAFDCGTLALYHLLRIEGRPTNLVVIGRHLPPMPPVGYSLLELRAAAKACGLRLSGLRLESPARRIDRPMIALLKRGHYVVVRPVGHSGRLVQTIDGANPAEIVDRQVLAASGDWAGLFLAPGRTR